ncbi:RNA polymerase sigma-I factor [Desulforamulus hydrothermalis]|uniref:RNA polymerase sigma factor SigI n=1 Tax=Desulforamulus hydrothermalis Lam5 = DSM 18033 TaxID=1121428 RepID=K8EC78_9FIRM|nr:RNA polymerase sigma-I factor [Desulforamulus hydrothermalis]CCO09293.1 Sigma-70 region 2 domain protein [Desulforamulus hydrothermalis Lam5 = DSM 18033]SHH04767.1 RNA polymerase sigma factor [Desulforamulus hydrothermalis Lam5 = DSM 18033]
MILEQAAAQYLDRARQGDHQAREQLIAEAKPYIQTTCSKVCGRLLAWGRDDELSVGLMAFNEAIDRFTEKRNMPFWGFARLVIKSRLADHFRREARHRHRPLEYQATAELPVCLETTQAWEDYWQAAEARERQEEVLDFQKELSLFGITINELVEASPKHRDTRENLLAVAKQVAEQPALLAHLMRTKRLPVKELALSSGLHRKTIEKGRRYIIAMALLLHHKERFIYLYSYLKLTGWSRDEGGK